MHRQYETGDFILLVDGFYAPMHNVAAGGLMDCRLPIKVKDQVVRVKQQVIRVKQQVVRVKQQVIGVKERVMGLKEQVIRFARTHSDQVQLLKTARARMMPVCSATRKSQQILLIFRKAICEILFSVEESTRVTRLVRDANLEYHLTSILLGPID